MMTTTTTPEKTNRSTVRLVYIGVRQGAKKKLQQYFYKIEKTGALSEQTRAYSGIKGLGRPGAIYDVDCDANDDSTIYTKSWSYVGQWADEHNDDVVQWQAKHDAARAADAARRRHNREAKRNLVEEQLRPLREVYWQCSGLERAAMLAQVVGYITSTIQRK